MKKQTAKEFAIFQKQNGCSLTYLIEKNANIQKVNVLIKNILKNENSFTTGILYSSIGIGGLFTTLGATFYCNRSNTIAFDEELFAGWEEVYFDYEVSGKAPIFLRWHALV